MATPTEDEKTFLRDKLAIDRTCLANERTLLAYVRTALAFGAVGGTLLKFFDTRATQWSGSGFLVLGAITVVVGAYRFQTVRRGLKRRYREV